jgi:hypothetical protein
MKFKELTPQEKIDYAARYIIVHSIIYYELNESVISDKLFDKKAAILVKLMNKYPEETRNSEYYRAIYDFDGSTGFHLYSRLKKSQRRYLKQIARNIIRLYKEDGG